MRERDSYSNLYLCDFTAAEYVEGKPYYVIVEIRAMVCDAAVKVWYLVLRNSTNVNYRRKYRFSFSTFNYASRSVYCFTWNPTIDFSRADQRYASLPRSTLDLLVLSLVVFGAHLMSSRAKRGVEGSMEINALNAFSNLDFSSFDGW